MLAEQRQIASLSWLWSCQGAGGLTTQLVGHAGVCTICCSNNSSSSAVLTVPCSITRQQAQGAQAQYQRCQAALHGSAAERLQCAPPEPFNGLKPRLPLPSTQQDRCNSAGRLDRCVLQGNTFSSTKYSRFWHCLVLAGLKQPHTAVGSMCIR
jgi:hypothetical protein